MGVELVTQRWATDCGICAMAMATGQPYLRILRAAPIYTDEDFLCGLILQQVVTTLRRLNYSPKWAWPHKLSPHNEGVPLRERLRGVNAIHLVESKDPSDEGAYHYVYVHNGVVYDPAPEEKEVYTNYDELLPIGAVYNIGGNPRVPKEFLRYTR